MNITIAPNGVDGPRRLSDLLAEQIDEVRHRYARSPVAPTGIDALDRLLGPVQQGWTTLIASREAVGRTTLAIQMAIQQTAAGGLALLMSSTLSRNEVALRVLAIEADVGVGKLLDARLTERDWSHIGRVVAGSRREMLVASGVRGIRDLEVVLWRALNARNVPSVIILDDANALLNDTRATRADAFDLLESMMSSLGVALILTLRLDSHDLSSTARTRLLDDIPNRVAGSIVMLEPDERAGGATAHVIRTIAGVTGTVDLVRGPRSPRFYGVADQAPTPNPTDHSTATSTATSDAFTNIHRSDHDD